MRASIVIRTLNEAQHLDDLLVMIGRQQTPGLEVETVLIDSGSTDGTLEIARRHGCRITHITKAEFSFGRSLNRGCAASTGNDYFDAATGCCLAPLDHALWGSVCRKHLDFILDAKLFQNLYRI